MSAADRTSEIVVVFPEGRGVERWRERKAESPMPGEWPYGLNALGTRENPVSAMEVPELGRKDRMLMSTLGPRRPRGEGDGPGVALTWDEQTGLRAVSQVQSDRLFTGVIWATDKLAQPEGAKELALLRKALLRFDGLWCLSRPQVEVLQQWLGPDAPPVTWVRFGVDHDFYAPANYPEQPMIVSIGGDRDRDPATLFAALEVVLAERPDVRVVVQTKSDLPAPKGVETHEFIPHDQVRRLYAQGSVVAVATRPNVHVSAMTVALEAMSVGRPVVVCDTPGMEDYVEHGITGCVVPVGDASAMAASVLGLLDDPAGAAEMGRRGSAAVQERFSTEAMCRQIRDFVLGG